MKFTDIKVGQTVRHHTGFTGEVESATEGTFGGNIVIRVTKQGQSAYTTGEIYTALPEYLTLVSDVNTSTKVDTEIDTDLMEEVRELIDIELEVESERSVFECSIEGLKFKGTKSDYEVFIEGAINLMKLGNKLI